MSMEEKQNFQTSLDFNQNIFKPSTREEIVEIVKNCYKKSIPLEISGLQSKNKIGRNFQAEKTLDPNSLLNPGKVYPILRKCAEEGRVHVHGGKTKFPDIPRF